MVWEVLPNALSAALSPVPSLLWAAPLPTLLHAPHSVLSLVPLLPVQAQAPPPADSDSDSDYEHYDFSSQPPVALSTFYSECGGRRGPLWEVHQ